MKRFNVGTKFRMTKNLVINGFQYYEGQEFEIFTQEEADILNMEEYKHITDTYEIITEYVCDHCRMPSSQCSCNSRVSQFISRPNADFQIMRGNRPQFMNFKHLEPNISKQ